jgi:deoxyribodipyrimidine photo-lyase
MVHADRICDLNDKPIDDAGNFVLYWMQASQRTRFNFALEHAIAQANELKKPLVVCFGLMDDYPEANERHYAFMLEGLRDVHASLAERGILFVVKHGQPKDVAVHFARRAALVVCDRGYLKHQVAWRDHVADHAKVRVTQVEGDVVVPAERASTKHEIGARTLRPKIHKVWNEFLVELKPGKLKHPSLKLDVRGDLDVMGPAALLKKLKLDCSVAASPTFTGGEDAAAKLLKAFLKDKLPGYAEGRNEPAAGQSSTMSGYLHFGQIAPVELALAVRDAKAPQADRDAYLEELIVRRELSVNFVTHNPRYDSYDGLPEWAKKSLAEHKADKRYHVYTRQQLEAAATHDPYWNAAQKEMNLTGFMHNYMRMYWGKKILEWTPDPREAYDATIYLNNKYFLCGRDPNAWANVAWVYGLHDRPWGPERPVFGLIRYMNDKGLERKFDIQKYVVKVDDLERSLAER